MDIHRTRAILRIHNLRLKVIIGLNDWERSNLQDIIVNVSAEFDASEAIATDTVIATVDYKDLKKKIMLQIPSTSYNLLEKLTDHILQIIMEDQRITSATVRVDKPGALRFADSASIELSARRGQ